MTISRDDRTCRFYSFIRESHLCADMNMNQMTDNRLQKGAGSNSPYGKEVILDLHDCDSSKFTRHSIETYFAEMCELIDMERCDLHFWDDVGVPEAEQQTDPKTKGTSAVQFILTSTIVIHTLDLLQTAYINIFSCKEFDHNQASHFTAKWFVSTEWTMRVVMRR